MKIFVEVLKLNFEFGLDSPVIVTVGNWTQGIDFEYEGLLISDNELVTNEKPVVNKTLIITTIESDSCYRLTSMGEEEGYCVELATHLSKLVGFDYKFKIVADNRYGRPDTITGYWDGMIGELTRGVRPFLKGVYMNFGITSTMSLIPKLELMDKIFAGSRFGSGRLNNYISESECGRFLGPF